MLISKPTKDSPSTFSVTLRSASATLTVSLFDDFAEAQSQEHFPQSRRGGPHASWKICSEEDCIDEVFLNDKCLIHQLMNAQQDFVDFQQRAQSKILSIRFQTIDNSSVARIIQLAGEWGASALSFFFCDFTDQLKIVDTDMEIPLTFYACDFRQGFHIGKCTFANGLSFDYSRIPSLTLRSVRIFDRLSFRFTIGPDKNLGTGGPGKLNISDSDISAPVVLDGSLCGLFITNAILRSGVQAIGAECAFLSFRNMDEPFSLRLYQCAFGGGHFQNLSLREASEIGEFSCTEDFTLQHVRFLDRADFEYSGKVIRLFKVSMLDGGRIRIGHGEIALVNSSSSAPLFISGKVGTDKLPHLISVYESNVTNLHFSNIDMSSCLLYAAIGLSNMTIEMSVRFAEAPTFFSQRPIVADEYWVRRKKANFLNSWWLRHGPKDIIDGRDIDRSIPDSDILPLLSFKQVAIVYRMLKRAQDSEQNFSGGSDFFYGEMEMRRRSKDESFANRFILTLYWFASGYGLRAWRAFSFFGAIVVFGAVLGQKYAFCDDDGTFSQALNFALRSTIPGLRPVEVLSSAGKFLEIGLAVLGPIFFAMGAVALRARVRR